MGRQASKKLAKRRHEEPVRHPLSPLRLALLLTLGLAGLSLFPRVSANARLAGSVLAAAAALGVLQLVLRRQVERSGREIGYAIVPVRVHYVQAMMQACVYAYWGWYWPKVYGQIPLIAAQLLFAYALDMLVCWLRRDKWVLGFGPFPIIFSTNLFMWFKDDWFFLQFLMVATGVAGKEFVKWTRDGRATHVFNPSAISLFLFSLGLIATGSTGITWGAEIAATLGLPSQIYLEIFLVGLVVQALFSVTLVTLSAAATLYAMNIAYTGWAGTYHFLVTNIPVAVFLGLHLLVTDPATSPRTTLGKVVFGSMYGAASFALFGLLGWFGIPTFYDKLLCVPVLNLTVRWLDRVSRALAERFQTFAAVSAWDPTVLNRSSMAVWVSLFILMTATGFLSKNHPGRDPGFWRHACEERRPNGCRTWLTLLEFTCKRDPQGCNTLGTALNEGRLVARNAIEAGKSFARACDLGLRDGCSNLEKFVHDGGRDVLAGACAAGDGAGCFILGELNYSGFGIPKDEAAGFDLSRQACAAGWPRGCARLGESYLVGKGTSKDPAKAIEGFEKACHGGHAPSCSALAFMYREGTGGRRDTELAAQWSRQACKLGVQTACGPGETPVAASPITDPAVELLKLGG